MILQVLVSQCHVQPISVENLPNLPPSQINFSVMVIRKFRVTVGMFYFGLGIGATLSMPWREVEKTCQTFIDWPEGARPNVLYKWTLTLI